MLMWYRALPVLSTLALVQRASLLDIVTMTFPAIHLSNRAIKHKKQYNYLFLNNFLKLAQALL